MINTLVGFDKKVKACSVTRNASNMKQGSYIYAGSQSVGEVRNQQLSHSLMTGLQMDEMIARIALNQAGAALTPQTKTYLTDALGSVIAIAKADQTLEVGYAYSPYGQTSKAGVENQLQGSENNSQYTGRENDNNGLYYYRARYYDSILKRFISEDPIGLAGGINSFAYVEGDPVDFTDPMGLAKEHGNWCGGDWTGGRKEEYTRKNMSLYKDPIDPLDGACKRHDICYERCRSDDPCDQNARSQCFLKCDAVLAGAAGNEKGWGAFKVEAAMKRPSWLAPMEPGANGQQCMCNAPK